ncbi:hypothetical protein SCLCIDRAFT_301909 [Scleroderma citrinum Foug A]|uniref:Uncharacterized protein n=1 Tax=Scleroderma citrinum Foug A TaxID=1036808 RepID=A0A0C3D3T5_9AGAM|nr:hypothetical protein SCLCIDRAFT_301909 [Scleroderma citrinum Foug A]
MSLPYPVLWNVHIQVRDIYFIALSLEWHSNLQCQIYQYTVFCGGRCILQSQDTLSVTASGGCQTVSGRPQAESRFVLADRLLELELDRDGSQQP